MSTSEAMLPAAVSAPPPPPLPSVRSRNRHASAGKKTAQPQPVKDQTELAVSAVIKHLEKASDKSHRHMHDTFRSFLAVSLGALRRVPQDEWEDVCRGSEKVLNEYSMALAELIGCAALNFDDVLGSCFMRLSLGNSKTGQYFTNSHITHFCAQMTGFAPGRTPTPVDPLRVADLSCGSGAMLLSAAASVPPEWLSQGMFFVLGVDIDKTCAMMAELNMMLHGIPGQIICGDGLAIGNSLKMRNEEEPATISSEQERILSRKTVKAPTTKESQITSAPLPAAMEPQTVASTTPSPTIMKKAPVSSAPASLPQLAFDWKL
jgi:hypothetical protein